LRPQQDGTFTGELNKSQYISLQRFCRKNHLRYGIADEFGERGTEYRRTFFLNNKPHLFGGYFCAYCGKLLPPSKVTVDHIIPVGVANKDLNLRKRLKFLGYKNINDPRNLVAACGRCNKSKGTRMGSWVIKGRIGRHPSVWMIRHSIRIAVILFCISYVFLHF